jgi:hypothetical protein
MLVFNNYFYKNKKSKLYFGDRVTVLNDFFTKPEGVLSLQFYVKGVGLNKKAI